jgi:hypothetical protein
MASGDRDRSGVDDFTLPTLLFDDKEENQYEAFEQNQIKVLDSKVSIQ